jgi:2-C-methyl-D-erythritol 4-phosphate cytidylyltransferase
MSFKTLAILVAAGRGERLGGARPKAFQALGGVPMLLRAAIAFDAAPSVDALVAIVPATELESAQEILEPIGKLFGVASGGERRQDSVQAGLALAPRGYDGIVLVHDAARPLVPVELIEAVAAAARQRGAALPVLPVTDTIKRVREGRVDATLERGELSAAQTPQGFRFKMLAEAYAQAGRDGLVLTDESMALEQLGQPVWVLPGSARNRKITTREDLLWAESLLAREGGM